MSKNQRKLYLKIFVIIFFAIFIIFSSTWTSDVRVTIPSPLLVKEGVQATPSKTKAENLPLLTQGGVRGDNSLEQKNTQSVTVLAGEMTVHLSFAPNTLFYDALVQAQDSGKIAFNGKNYRGLGFFVTDIGPLHTGGGKDLLYYINGKEATVGVSLYRLKDGDIIEWKLE